MKLREIEKYKNVKTLTSAILVALGVSTIILMAIMAPNALQIFKPFLRRGRRKNYARDRIQQSLRSLKKRGFIEYTEQEKEIYVRLTKEGREYIKKFELDTLMLPRGRWDQKWRLILFDIPEYKGQARRALQERLKTLGCFPLQKSVFVYPHECREEISFLSAFFRVYPHIRYLEAEGLDHSKQEARRFFGV